MDSNTLKTREKIVGAADLLFYQNGFARTSFSDIAKKVKISRGNFYYHFETKDKILDAVISHRIENTREMLARWQTEGQTAEERIVKFIQILIENRGDILRFGCPAGTLSNELAKTNHHSHPRAVSIFTLFHKWLSKQFVALGCSRDADQMAMQLLARSQGIATLASAFADEKFIQCEVDQLCGWIAVCKCGADPVEREKIQRKK